MRYGNNHAEKTRQGDKPVKDKERRQPYQNQGRETTLSFQVTDLQVQESYLGAKETEIKPSIFKFNLGYGRYIYYVVR